MKSILVPVDEYEASESRLQLALDVARARDAHLTLLAAAAMYGGEAVVPYGGLYGGAFPYAAVREAIDEAQTKLEKRLEERLAGEDVRWDYARVTDDPYRAILSWGAVADLIVMSPPAAAHGVDDAGLAGRVLVGAHTPVLLAPVSYRPFDATAPALVAWNGSFEAANALRGAVPLLRKASAVTLLTIADNATTGDMPGINAAEYLSRHGVTSELSMVKPDGRSPAEVIRDHAARLGAGLVVMGAYGHSRVREYWFGGATRETLAKVAVPTLLAH